jgi:hypothetical protein
MACSGSPRPRCYGLGRGGKKADGHGAPEENGASLGVLAPVCHPALGTDRELEYQQNAFAGDLFPPRSRYPLPLRSRYPPKGAFLKRDKQHKRCASASRWRRSALVPGHERSDRAGEGESRSPQ